MEGVPNSYHYYLCFRSDYLLYAGSHFQQYCRLPHYTTLPSTDPSYQLEKWAHTTLGHQGINALTAWA